MLRYILAAGAALFFSAEANTASAITPKITIPASCFHGGLGVQDYTTFKNAVKGAVLSPDNGGLGFNMWATLVANDGTVCAVVFSGATYTDQWLGSRLISAQKAFTGVSYSLGATTGSPKPGKFALSTANLYSAVQPGGSLFGLQHSNPVASAEAYGDTILNLGGSSIYRGPLVAPSTTYGTINDPMVTQVIGGVNVFGGGLPLYDANGKVGGIGVSGDTSCTDHMVAWRIRHILNLDLLATAGISGPSDAAHPDNIIFDITANPNGGTGISASGFGHPSCGNPPNPATLPAVQ